MPVQALNVFLVCYQVHELKRLKRVPPARAASWCCVSCKPPPPFVRPDKIASVMDPMLDQALKYRGLNILEQGSNKKGTAAISLHLVSMPSP